jgi:hypothetical protein
MFSTLEAGPVAGTARRRVLVRGVILTAVGLVVGGALPALRVATLEPVRVLREE